MISVKKDFDVLPPDLDSDLRTGLIVDSLTTKSKHVFKSIVYRDTTIDALKNLYNSKCAYCETDTSAGAPMQVEHYRPKAKVTEDSNHDGYYWVAYEWSNLILSCSKCNSKKRNRFPVAGTRVIMPVLDFAGMPDSDSRLANSIVLIEERAMLIHPEIDRAEDHFLFTPEAEILALTPRAEETIEICGLNRKELVFKRLKLLNDYKDEIKEILADYLSKKISSEQCRHSIKRIFQKIALLQEPQKEYSRFGFFMFYKFDLFIANTLEDKQKAAVGLLFEQFISGDL